ncbi:hypothetical protein BVC80_8667g11 [Macleaya cordata]|uniref:Uncharacterized protein n=1 Tax=Macleaya cordata TaxID=56857 RepID=A0A200Q582_MACCD|nr:hypothetical protein BVC80_8667g11 [Macleaya cordata]
MESTQFQVALISSVRNLKKYLGRNGFGATVSTPGEVLMLGKFSRNALLLIQDFKKKASHWPQDVLLFCYLGMDH